MRSLILVAATLALSACGDSRSTSNTSTTGANTMMSDSMMMMNGSDPMMGGGMGNSMGGTMGNGMGVDPATQNAMRQDMNTNDPDTNLANGM